MLSSSSMSFSPSSTSSSNNSSTFTEPFPFFPPFLFPPDFPAELALFFSAAASAFAFFVAALFSAAVSFFPLLLVFLVFCKGSLSSYSVGSSTTLGSGLTTAYVWAFALEALVVLFGGQIYSLSWMLPISSGISGTSTSSTF